MHGHMHVKLTWQYSQPDLMCSTFILNGSIVCRTMKPPKATDSRRRLSIGRRGVRTYLRQRTGRRIYVGHMKPEAHFVIWTSLCPKHDVSVVERTGRRIYY